MINERTDDDIGEPGATSISEALKHNSVLTALDLGGDETKQLKRF